MKNPFVYAIQEDGRLLWYHHLGTADGSNRWEGPKEIGTGWDRFKKVFSGGDNIIYAIDENDNLIWYRHAGQQDGTFRWEGPSTVGHGWDFAHVVSCGNGIIYAIEHLEIGLDGSTTGGHILWYHHLGAVDGTDVWADSIRFNSWNFATNKVKQVFTAEGGIIYTVRENGDLYWHRHLDYANGGIRWNRPKKVGNGWRFDYVFSIGGGIIYGLESTEIAIQTGRRTGGRLQYYHHLGYLTGSVQWEGPKQQIGMAAGVRRFSQVFSGGLSEMVIPNPNNGIFCDFPDPLQGVGLHTTAYTLKEFKRKLTLYWAIAMEPDGVTLQQLPGVNMQGVIVDAFRVWKLNVPKLNFLYNQGSPDITFSVGPLAPDKIGSATRDGTSIVFSTLVMWTDKNPIPAGSNNLLSVAIHEIGHAIGLLHNWSQSSVMYKSSLGLELLSDDDVRAANALYGWETQQPIPNRGSDCGPAICACGNVLVMAWKGIEGDSSIFYSSSTDGTHWSDQKIIEGVGTSDTPSLAWDGTLLWMAWVGVPGDSALYYATTNDPTSWPPNPGLPISNVGSSNGPSIAMVPEPMLIWKGFDDDSTIYFSIFNAGNNPPWFEQTPVGGVGTSDRPALVRDISGDPLMVWKGIVDDSNLYFSCKTGTLWQPQRFVSWNVPVNAAPGTEGVKLPGTSNGPGITTDFSRIFLAWRGAGNDSSIWFTQRTSDIIDGVNVVGLWSSQGNIPDVGTSHRPAVAFFSGRIYVTWKGVGDDSTLWITRQ